MHTIIRYALVIAAGIAAAAMLTSLDFNWRNFLMVAAAVVAARMAFRYLFGGRRSE